MTAHACISEPISWPRLEAFAIGQIEPATRSTVAQHLDACEACRRCLGEIRGDLVALPPLPGVPAVRRPRWRTWLAPALGLAVAAVLAIVLWRGGATPGDAPSGDTHARDRVAIKGVGEVLIGVVRERAGVIAIDATTFRPDDRWKVVITCPPTAHATFAVEIREGGRDAIDPPIHRPIAPTTLACGNRVAVPGAFVVTGEVPHQVCVRITTQDASDQACVTIVPE